MGQTIIEKIIVGHTREEVRPGEVAWINLDVRSARDFAGANVVKNFEREYPNESVADPEKTFFTFDCVAPANTIPYAENQQTCRQFAERQGIRVYDVDRGIGSHVLIEEGLALPGTTIVGTDSHLNLLGAVGAFGQGMGDRDISYAFKTGQTWFDIPETIRIELRGTYSPPTSAKDLTLAIVGRLGSSGALGRAVEIYGPAIDSLCLAGRITLASMATEMGAVAIILQPNEEVLNFCNNPLIKYNLEAVRADPDAKYIQIVEIDISDLKPQVASPPSPDNVQPVVEVQGISIGSAFLGSCTNGRLEDFQDAARILKGKRIATGVRLSIVPATREVFGQMLSEGLVEIFHRAGAIVSHPCCGGCASGQLGMTGTGEVQVSTGNRNFPGKQGKGATYLASPATVVASAIAGKLVNPEEYIS